jgi:UDP-N-acetyl-2-amino-2-deoxyglucuronate dehydrogenase
MKLRLGLIGCGGIGRHHAVRLVRQRDISLAGVTDVRSEAAAAAGSEFGAPVFASIEAMLASGAIDAVLIASPNATHHGITLAACAAGKHVFCEKPMARTVRECDEMIAAARGAGVKLMVGQVLRLMVPFARVRQVVQSGEFGQPMVLDIVRARWSSWVGHWRGQRDLAWGILHEVNTHEFDLMRSLCGEVAEVHATVGNFVQKESDYEDTALVTLRFRNGAVGFLHSSVCSTVPVYKGLITCERGTIAFDRDPTFDSDASCVEYRLAGEETSTKLDLVPDSVEDGYSLEQRSFAEWVLFDYPPVFTGDDGRAAVEVAEAAYMSADRRVPVTLPL